MIGAITFEWCEWCKKRLKVVDGLKIHEAVPHPDYFWEKGHC